MKKIVSFSDLNENTKLGELKEKINSVFPKLALPLEIRAGFPPTVLSLGDGETLKSCGISTGGEF